MRASASAKNLDLELADEISRFYGIVYVITNLVNGKYYVGQTSRGSAHRWSVHKSEARRRPKQYIHKAISKYGEESFDVQVVATARDRDELNALEALWILITRSHDPKIGYNLTLGGDCGQVTEAAREKMSQSAKRRGMRWIQGKNAWAKGKHFSEEHRRHLSEANKGKRPSENCLQRVAEANRHRVVSEETRIKLSAAAAKANAVRWGRR